MNALMSLRIEVTWPDGSVEIRDVQRVSYLPNCKNDECKQQFRTPDPRKEYCSYECQERAKYRRWQKR